METLKRRIDFIRASESGKSVVTSGLVIQHNPNANTDGIRIGITATRKIGNAVVRNRTKRRLRALFRECLNDPKGKKLLENGSDYVLIGRKSTRLRPYGKLQKDLRYALHQLKTTGENEPKRHEL